jgi:hypothetical protein
MDILRDRRVPEDMAEAADLPWGLTTLLLMKETS